jgi:outer membrane lipoprotein-sorting protein
LSCRALSLVAVLLSVLCSLAGGVASHARAAEGAASAPLELEKLMTLLASSRGVRANFTEVRRLSILSEPIETRGVLYFAPPDRLARHTASPGSASIVVDGERVVFRDELGRQVLDLGASEVARSLVENLMALLRGDLAALRERFSVDFQPDGGQWVLDLEPRGRAVRAIIAQIRARGNGRGLGSVETLETNGDTTLMVFEDVRTGLDFEPADLERFFSFERPDEDP